MDKVNGNKSMIYLYQYINIINGKSYIGITNNPLQRQKDHKKARSGAVAFNRAMKKYGINAFKFNILAIFDDENAAAYHESSAINKFKTLTPNGYNLTAGKPYSKYRGTFAEETKQKISNKLKGRIISPENKKKLMIGLKKYWLSPSAHELAADRQKGKKHSLESRLKRSIKLKGRKRTEEDIIKTKNGLSRYWLSTQAHIKAADGQKGRKHSLESRIKRSIASKRTWLSEEYREKITNSRKGKKLSMDQCKAISNSLMGHKHSEETKLKIKNSIILHHSNPEYRRKCSESQKGRRLSPEQCKAISERMKGKKYSIERCTAISKGMCKHFGH